MRKARFTEEQIIGILEARCGGEAMTFPEKNLEYRYTDDFFNEHDAVAE